MGIARQSVWTFDEKLTESLFVSTMKGNVKLATMEQKRRNPE